MGFSLSSVHLGVGRRTAQDLGLSGQKGAQQPKAVRPPQGEETQPFVPPYSAVRPLRARCPALTVL